MSACITAFLRAIPLCQELNDKELAMFAEILEPQWFPAGTKIIRQGDPGSIFYLLREGQVGVYRGTTGDKMRRVATLSPPEAIGHLCLLDGQPREATVIADKAVLLLTGTKRRFDACLERGDTFAFKLLESITRDLCARVRQVSRAFYQVYANPHESIRRLEVLAREQKKLRQEEAAAVRYVRTSPERQRQRAGARWQPA